MLEIKELCAYYGESIILNRVNLQVPDGQVVCLIGRNGVGKTTLLKSIMGLVKTPSGSIQLAGRELMGQPVYARAQQGIGYVPQGRDIFPQMSIAENLTLGLEVLGGKGQVEEDIFEASLLCVGRKAIR